MRWFSFPGLIVFSCLLCLVVFLARYVVDYYGLYYLGGILQIVAPWPLLIYASIWYWKWNKGEAGFL